MYVCTSSCKFQPVLLTSNHTICQWVSVQHYIHPITVPQIYSISLTWTALKLKIERMRPIYEEILSRWTNSRINYIFYWQNVAIQLIKLLPSKLFWFTVSLAKTGTNLYNQTYLNVTNYIISLRINCIFTWYQYLTMAKIRKNPLIIDLTLSQNFAI